MNEEISLTRIPPEGHFDRVTYRINEDLVIGNYKIPSGFITDGLSLPSVVRAFYSPMGKGFRAAVLHDYLLYEGRKSRRKCAREFRKQLIADGVNPAITNAMFMAVRLWDQTHGLG